MPKQPSKQQLNVRLDSRLIARIREACERSDERPYAPTMTQLAERGFQLALEEKDKKKL